MALKYSGRGFHHAAEMTNRIQGKNQEVRGVCENAISMRCSLGAPKISARSKSEEMTRIISIYDVDVQDIAARWMQAPLK